MVRIPMDSLTLEKLKQALQNEHDRLVAELKGFARPDPRVAGDWHARYPQFEMNETGSHAAQDEEADEVEEYEMRLATEGSLESRLLEVNRALERIKLDAYGTCAKCRKPISLERLRANPAAEFDIGHETQTS